MTESQSSDTLAFTSVALPPASSFLSLFCYFSFPSQPAIVLSCLLLPFDPLISSGMSPAWDVCPISRNLSLPHALFLWGPFFWSHKPLLLLLALFF